MMKIFLFRYHIYYYLFKYYTLNQDKQSNFSRTLYKLTQIMNFFKPSPQSRKKLSQTSEIFMRCPCEDLPHNMSASKIILKLPLSPPKASKYTPSIPKSHITRPIKNNSQILTIGEIDNSEFYNNPNYSFQLSKTFCSFDVLPHRYGVECNDLHRVRSRIKNRPKLRRLIIKQHQ